LKISSSLNWNVLKFLRQNIQHNWLTIFALHEKKQVY
jgi:hypothetical protein